MRIYKIALVVLVIGIAVYMTWLSNTLAAINNGDIDDSRNADWTPVFREEQGVEMVLVPGGCFMMGRDPTVNDSLSGYDSPAHEVCVESFWIDRTEVTNEQFDRLGGVAYRPSSGLYPHYPRANVSWNSADNFCRNRAGRLPTEPEWEYAARGPDSWLYPWGNQSQVVAGQFCDPPLCGMSQPLGGPIGQSLHQQSWVGALDMLGGLMEWTNSYFDYYPYDPMNELPGGYGTKIVRGAVYYAEDRLFPVTYRTRWLYPGDRYYFLGFRCARDLAAGEQIPSFSG